MASPSVIKLTPASTGVYSVPNLRQDSADLTSKLLQENHEKHHVFFNQRGFHNHIAHHLLTIFALGASPELIQRHYDNNASYQRAPLPVHKDIDDGKLEDPEVFKKHLGDEKYYGDYMMFFRAEMERSPDGYRDVVKKYLFSGDQRADDLLCRMFAGVMHSVIHLGFGVEFEQPAIVAEALAQAAVHPNWIGPWLLDAEKAASVRKEKGEASQTLVKILETSRKDDKFRNSPRMGDTNKLRDGILVRAYDEMVKYASQWYVTSEDLEARTAEMHDFCAYFAGAAQRPSKQVKFDFFYMHSLNASIFFSAFLEQSWLSDADKARLLSFKGRVDLAEWAHCGFTELFIDEINKYEPQKPSKSTWDDVIQRVIAFEDDGHASKLVRTLASGSEVTAKFENSLDMQVRGGSWLREANMAIDSVEAGEPRWVRNAGYDQSWESVPDRTQARL